MGVINQLITGGHHPVYADINVPSMPLADVFQALTAHLRAEKAAQAAQLGTKARGVWKGTSPTVNIMGKSWEDHGNIMETSC